MLSRADVQPVQVLDAQLGRFLPVEAYQPVGVLGVSNLAELSGNRLLVATQDGIGIVQHRSLARLGPMDLQDVHEVTLGDGTVLVADAAQDVVVVLDERDLAVVERLHPPTPGTFHLNQALAHCNQLLAVVHDVRGRARRGRNGLVVHHDGGVIDLRTGAALIHGLRAPHSLRRVDDGWILIDSGHRRLQILDDAWMPRGEVELPGWGRGLARDEATGAIHVGISPPRPRYQRALGWKVQRHPSVVQIDLATMSVANTIQVDHAEQINGVHLVTSDLLDLD